jgi:hypothetical protein
MIDPMENLSPEGAARREAILRQTLLAVRRRRRSRRALRLTAGLAVLVLGVVLIRLPREPGTTPPSGGRPGEIVHAGPLVPTPAPPAGPFVQVIPPDPEICARLAAPPLVPTWRPITDDQLLAALSEAGQPAGLVRVAGRTLLMSQQ